MVGERRVRVRAFGPASSWSLAIRVAGAVTAPLASFLDLGQRATDRVASWARQRGPTRFARLFGHPPLDQLFGNVGQANYGAAKAGIAAFSIISAMELGRYGVSVNAIAPVALTRMTEDLAGFSGQEPKEGEWNPFGPENISPLVVWLGSNDSAAVTGRVFMVTGGTIAVVEGWANGPSVDAGRKWEPGELSEVIPELVAKAAPNANMGGTRS